MLPSQAAEALAQQPPRAVACDGPAHAPPHGEAETAPGSAVGVQQQQEQPPRLAAATLEHGSKLGLAPQALPWA
jgi:hypothetical protein